jgi:hypothetical protein
MNTRSIILIAAVLLASSYTVLAQGSEDNAQKVSISISSSQIFYPCGVSDHL